MIFDESLARSIAAQFTNEQNDEKGLIEAFAQVCNFLRDHPDRLSRRSTTNESLIYTASGLQQLARDYFSAYRRSSFPAKSSTTPDKMVSIVMMEAFGYPQHEIDQIKVVHQQAMSAENCVGALLERYLDSVLRLYGWYWCCGDFVKAIDFISRNQGGTWLALQIKNRDNSENSSSGAIRRGTTIQKWYRSFSQREATNWHKLPSLMQGYNLSEQGFEEFVRDYLRKEKQRMQISS